MQAVDQKPDYHLEWPYTDLVMLTWNAIAAFSEECVAKLVATLLSS